MQIFHNNKHYLYFKKMSDKKNSFSTKKRQLARKSTAKSGYKRHFESIQNESLTNENNIQVCQNQRSVNKRT